MIDLTLDPVSSVPATKAFVTGSLKVNTCSKPPPTSVLAPPPLNVLSMVSCLKNLSENSFVLLKVQVILLLGEFVNILNSKFNSFTSLSGRFCKATPETSSTVVPPNSTFLNVKGVLLLAAVGTSLRTKWVVSSAGILAIKEPAGIPAPLTANPTTILELASCATIFLAASLPVWVTSHVESIKLTDSLAVSVSLDDFNLDTLIVVELLLIELLEVKEFDNKVGDIGSTV